MKVLILRGPFFGDTFFSSSVVVIVVVIVLLSPGDGRGDGQKSPFLAFTFCLGFPSFLWVISVAFPLQASLIKSQVFLPSVPSVLCLVSRRLSSYTKAPIHSKCRCLRIHAGALLLNLFHSLVAFRILRYNHTSFSNILKPR